MKGLRYALFGLVLGIWLLAPGVVHAICAGDCDADGRVTVAELVRGVQCVLMPRESASCEECYDSALSISSLITAVNNALDGCVRAAELSPATPTPIPDPEELEEFAVFTFVPFRQCTDTPPDGEFDPTPLVESLRADGWRIDQVVVTIAEASCMACGCPWPGSPVVEVAVSR